MPIIYVPLHVRVQERYRHLMRNQLPQLAHRIPLPVTTAVEVVGAAVAAVILLPIYAVGMTLLYLSERRRKRMQARHLQRTHID